MTLYSNAMEDVVLTPVDFVALLNQTLEFAYPRVVISGELANFRVSKNKWVYFDLKDEYASVKFFGTVYQLSGPLEDGLLLEVSGSPRLHPQYGFSVTVQAMRPVGEGSIKRAAALLEAKLAAEGLFDPERKRSLPYPPKRIGLIASKESAAYHDFIKILNERWGGVTVELADVQVQGEPAVSQIISALEYFSGHAEPVDVVVITRGGGSPEDLAAFSTEQVTRAVAASRIPTLVAIGHEIDISLAELAADQRASTPSNAAQLLVPDKHQLLEQFLARRRELSQLIGQMLDSVQREYVSYSQYLSDAISKTTEDAKSRLSLKKQVLSVLDPSAALRRGYAIIRIRTGILRSVKQTKSGDPLEITLADGNIQVEVQ